MPDATLPLDLGSLLELYTADSGIREQVAHNTEILKCVRGGLRMAERHRLRIDPRREYWRLPERRFCVAYFADRWTGRFLPAAALRHFAQQVFAHFDRARTEGIVSLIGVDYEQAGGFDKIRQVFVEHARRLPPIPAWRQLRELWPKIADEPADDIANFFSQLTTQAEAWQRPFNRRLPWFGYLGAASVDDLISRQAFFYGYANLWTTVNAYVTGGSVAFAPVLQNTKSELMLESALRWANGITPVAKGFHTLGRNDEDDHPEDRSQVAVVIEIFGFLNLERAPFYNSRAGIYRDWLHLSDTMGAYDVAAAVGTETKAWLDRNPDAVDGLLRLFRDLLGQPPKTRVEIEAVDAPKARKRAANANDQLLDARFITELDDLAKADLQRLSPKEAAALTLHLLLDTRVYTESSSVSRQPPSTQPAANAASTHVRILAQSTTHVQTLSLPEALRPYGERALAYLRAGLHVLFAGSPGTGKTTLAQFVGHAWDNALSSVPDEISTDQAPLTTVGNSAWSPFHTVGGLMPDVGGIFRPHAGIFIDPTSTSADPWRLRDGAIVLDEMNRADLDRCIGELYPLLSGNVARVSPAGLPGVRTIVASPRFRVIATVNDATLDDIVFPISEGLARRFLRIPLPGASRGDVIAFLRLQDSPLSGKQAAVLEAVETFFEVVRDAELFTASDDGDDERLPFGVAYFGLLRVWLDGQFAMPLKELTPREEAYDLLASALRTMTRTRQWDEALRIFVAKA